MMGSMPTLCVEALVQFQRLGLRMKDYDLVMLQMVACECFYSIIDEVRKYSLEIKVRVNHRMFEL